MSTATGNLDVHVGEIAIELARFSPSRTPTPAESDLRHACRYSSVWLRLMRQSTFRPGLCQGATRELVQSTTHTRFGFAYTCIPHHTVVVRLRDCRWAIYACTLYSTTFGETTKLIKR